MRYKRIYLLIIWFFFMSTTIVESKRLDTSYNAVFYRPSRAVYIRAGLDPIMRTCAIAHELRYAHYPHNCFPHKQSTKWADEPTDHFLHEAAVQHTAYETEFEPAAIATELGVTQHILKSWCRRYQAGSTTCRCSLRNRPRDRIFI